MHNFKEFKVWQRGIKLAVTIYKITDSFPTEEKFGLISQIRRSAVSIASNIAEGAGRKTDKDFSNFLSMSLGSQYELETQLIICEQIGLLLDDQQPNEIFDELNEIQKMTRTLISKFA